MKVEGANQELCKFHNYKGKVKVLQNANKLKRTNISTNQDFSQETLAYTNKLWKEVKQLRSEGRTAYLNYHTIVFRDRNDSYSLHHFLSSLCRWTSFLLRKQWLPNLIVNLPFLTLF